MDQPKSALPTLTTSGLPTFHARTEGVIACPCRYGENKWQKPAGLYTTPSDDPLALPRFQLVGGDPSYVNWCDVDRGLATMTHIAAAFAHKEDESCSIAAIFKHGNACGASLSFTSRTEALKGAIDGDPEAAFGGVVLMNFDLTSYCAENLKLHRVPTGSRRVLDGFIAPAMYSEAIVMLGRKDGRGFFLANPALEWLSRESLDTEPIERRVRGGFLTQPNFTFVLDWVNPALRWYGPELTPEQKRDLLLAWAVGSTSTSNTITLARESRIIANATGQQSRVLGCELAILKAKRAGNDSAGCVAYSDSFFPFPDGPKVLIDAGITAIFASSGSIRDQETIKLCEERGITLCLIPDTDGRGFYGH